jgi:hypothetical protein
LIDEPYGNWSGHSPASIADVNALAERVKAAYPTKPTFVISDAQSMSSTATTASYASVDWVGFDCYGCGVTALDSLVAKMRSVLSPSQRMVAVPQSDQSVGADISSGTQYGIITNDTNYWHEKVLSDAKFIAVVPFLWTDIREGFYGARDMPWIKERMYQFEASVMPLADNHVYPLLTVASGTYVANQSPFGAFNGDTSDIWNSGGWPTQWIEGELAGTTRINRIVLTTNMTPAGSATHALWANTPTGWQLLQTFQGSFSDGQQLTWSGSVDAIAVLVVTSQSVSWVAWRDIEISHP